MLHLSPHAIIFFIFLFFCCSFQNEPLHKVLLVKPTFLSLFFVLFFTCFSMGNKNKTPAARAKAILRCRPYPTPLLLSVLLGFLTAWIHHHLFQNWAKRCKAWSPYLTWESAASPEWFQSHCRCWSTGCVSCDGNWRGCGCSEPSGVRFILFHFKRSPLNKWIQGLRSGRSETGATVRLPFWRQNTHFSYPGSSRALGQNKERGKNKIGQPCWLCAS